MKIHAKFNTYNMLNVQGKCIAYFYYNNGTAIKTITIFIEVQMDNLL